MTIEQDVYDGLAAHGGLAALVGTRIYQMAFPSGTTFPCVTFQMIFEPTMQVVPGAIVASSPRFQLTAWAEDRDDAASVGEQLKLAAVSMIGAFKDATVQGGPAMYEADASLFRRDVDVILLVVA
jgi:hypothetical protein